MQADTRGQVTLAPGVGRGSALRPAGLQRTLFSSFCSSLLSAACVAAAIHYHSRCNEFLPSLRSSDLSKNSFSVRVKNLSRDEVSASMQGDLLDRVAPRHNELSPELIWVYILFKKITQTQYSVTSARPSYQTRAKYLKLITVSTSLRNTVSQEFPGQHHWWNNQLPKPSPSALKEDGATCIIKSHPFPLRERDLPETTHSFILLITCCLLLAYKHFPFCTIPWSVSTCQRGGCPIHESLNKAN